MFRNGGERERERERVGEYYLLKNHDGNGKAQTGLPSYNTKSLYTDLQK